MSTYYALQCDVCQNSVPLVSVGHIATWMVGAPEHLLPFLTAHTTHYRSIRLVSEYDQWFAAEDDQQEVHR
jgi:hypothetical protein